MNPGPSYLLRRLTSVPRCAPRVERCGHRATRVNHGSPSPSPEVAVRLEKRAAPSLHQLLSRTLEGSAADRTTPRVARDREPSFDGTTGHPACSQPRTHSGGCLHEFSFVRSATEHVDDVVLTVAVRCLISFLRGPLTNLGSCRSHPVTSRSLSPPV